MAKRFKMKLCSSDMSGVGMFFYAVVVMFVVEPKLHLLFTASGSHLVLKNLPSFFEMGQPLSLHRRDVYGLFLLPPTHSSLR
jgi:hypothetical protein